MARLGRGANGVKQPVEITNLRELTRADLAVLAQPRPGQSLQTMRDTHHRAARAVAAGLTNIQVAETCGRSINGVSMLKSDPAFNELVAHYRAIITAEWKSEADPVVTFMRDNALKAQAMISDKLDAAIEQGEFLPTRDLLGIAEFGSDRTGYGKVNKNVNINVDFAAQLEAARKRSANIRQIEATEVPTLSVQSQSPPGSHLPSPRPVASSLTPRILRRV
jgi:hypothetical protein